MPHILVNPDRFCKILNDPYENRPKKSVTSGQIARVRGHIRTYQDIITAIAHMKPINDGPDLIRRRALSGAGDGLLAEIMRELEIEQKG